MSDALDHRRLLDEIDAEVRRQRAEGGEDLAAFERDLAGAFARFAPLPPGGGGFDDVLSRAEHASFIDARPTFASARPLVGQVKGLVHRAVAFEVHHLAVQVSAFASTVTEALRALGTRLDALESPPAAPADGPVLDPLPWAAFLAGALAGAPGPVGVAGDGDAALAVALCASGLDALPVPAARFCGQKSPDSDDFRPQNGLGAVVVSGFADRFPLAGQAGVVRAAAAAVAPGGAVVLLGADPATLSPVESDLAAVRPLHGATWQVLLAEAGMVGATVEPGEGSQAVVARRPPSP